MTVPSADQPVRLPGGAALAPGEKPLLGHPFMYSTIAFYLHTEIVLTTRRLYAARPNTLFGLIPVGTQRAAYPIENIAGVGAATQFNVVGFLVGALALLVGFAGLSSSVSASSNAPLGITMVVIGALLIVGSPRQAIEVMNSGGGAIRFPVSVFERSRTIDFANRVSEAVAHTTSRPAVASPTQAVIAPGPDPGDALRLLTQMRDQGLVSEGEYADKRAEILARL